MAAFNSKSSTKSLYNKAGHFAPHIPVKREVFLQCAIKHVLTEWGFCLLVAIYVRNASFIGILLTPGASVYLIFRFTTTQEKLLNFRLLSNSYTENRDKP